MRQHLKGLAVGAAAAAGFLLVLLVLAVTAPVATAQQVARLIQVYGAVTPADNFSNPTNAISVLALNSCWDGATWDRCASGTSGAGASDSSTARVVLAQSSIFRSLDLDESEEDIKTSPGELCSLWVTNQATATRWLKFYNATAANVTVGTTAPVITIGIPGNSTDDVAGAFGLGNGCLAFSTAISAAATTGVADNDTGAPGSSDIIIVAGYR